MDRPALSLKAELEDFFTDLVGDFDDCRAQGVREFTSRVGSKFERDVRAMAARLQDLVEGGDLLDRPGEVGSGDRCDLGLINGL